MTAAYASLTDLDERTRGELQPPCLNTDWHGDNPPAASHVVQFLCDHTGGPTDFICTPCAAQLRVFFDHWQPVWDDLLVSWPHCTDSVRLSLAAI